MTTPIPDHGENYFIITFKPLLGKLGDFSGCDLHLLTGLRVSSLPGGSLGHAEGSKTNQGHFVAILQGLCDSPKDGINRRLSFFYRTNDFR